MTALLDSTSASDRIFAVNDDLQACLDTHPREDDPASERRRQARDLLTRVNGSREAIEQLRADLLRRLHRTIDDEGAVAGLRVVEAALALVPRSTGVFAWQQIERAAPRRWWGHGRPRR